MTSEQAPPLSQQSFLIIGSGIYGSSTALHLARLGYKNVKILDRSKDGFASSDAASNDLNKVIRADYKDEMYCSLGKEAIGKWRTDLTFSPFYHETGVIFRSGDGKDSFTERFKNQSQLGVQNAKKGKDTVLEIIANGKQLPESAYLLQSKQDILRSFPTSMHNNLGVGFEGFGEKQYGYCNPRGGWAEARNATRAALEEAVRIGDVKVIGEAIVTELIMGNEKDCIKGVKTKDGRSFFADHVILAVGSWSRLLITKLLPNSKTNILPPAFPSAQCVLTIRLTPEEAAGFKNTPVVVNHSNGFYIFEPNSDGILKCAIHGDEGYANPTPNYEENDEPYPSFNEGMKSNFSSSSKSQPSKLSKSSAQTFIPEDKVEQMMKELIKLYPKIQNVDPQRISSRICWYSDTHDENWLIDFHPEIKNLLIVGGDSGHAFKFLPVIGRLILAKFNLPQIEPLTDHQKKVFSFNHHMNLTKRVNDGERIESADSGRSSGPN